MADDKQNELHSIIADDSASAVDLADFFNRLPLERAVAAARSLSGTRVQGRLWEQVASNPPVVTSDLVPIDHPAMQAVVFHGKNSLPLFTEFEKICCRPSSLADSSLNELWGYNRSPTMKVVGPGYYVTHDTPDSELGACAFDYNRLPLRAAEGWPDIKPNGRGVSRFVYNRMIDYMRRVADDVFIGLATRDEKSMSSWFVLVREL